MNVKTRVDELEPEWLLIRFDGEKPLEMVEQASYLDDALWGWLAKHPPAALRRVMWIDERHERWGLLVWLELEPALRENPFLPARMSAAFKARLHTEHLEAFLHVAYQIYFKRPPGSPALAVVHRTGSVVIFDRVYKVAHALTLVEVQGLDDTTQEQMIVWSAKPDGAYLSVDLPTSYGDFRIDEQ